MSSQLDVTLPGRAFAVPLPTPPNPTIGRGTALNELHDLLGRPDVRLVTLVGAGGVGKTRLALEAARAVADRFPGGAAHVNLDGLEDAGVLAAEAAAALGVVAGDARELGEQLARATHGAPALLILDGFERFVEDAGEVARMLATVGHLKVLATSRAPLRLTAEHVYPVQPLSATDAAALFVARISAARAVDDEDRALVDAICARLDGLPLALELAADRARMLPLASLRSRLERRLDLLTGGPRDLPRRQRSLRATLEWSWDVLNDSERALMTRLAVFEGGAPQDAIEAVCNVGHDLGASVEGLLASLLDKTSLLRVEVEHREQPRFAMLDTVREFAGEQADPTPFERRHARYYLRYCAHAAEEAGRANRRTWLDRLARERPNIRLAFERLLRGGSTEGALRLAIAFARALPWDAHTHEVRGWLTDAVAGLGGPATALRAAALFWDGQLAISQARFGEAGARLEAALAAAHDAGEPALEAAALAALGRRATLVGSKDAPALCEEALAAARRVGDPALLADSLLNLAGSCERSRAWDRAARLAAESLELYRAVDDPFGSAAALAELGWYELVHERLGEAARYLDEAIDLRRRHGDDRRLVEPLIDHAWLALARRDVGNARRGFLQALALARQVDNTFIVGEALAGLSAVAALEARWVDAARLAGASYAMHERIGAPPWESVTTMHERAVAGARDALGAQRFAAHASEGGKRSPEDVVADAEHLGTTGTDPATAFLTSVR
jgi:predicted ATPase